MGIFDFFKKSFSGGILAHNLNSTDEDRVRSDWKRIEELLRLGKPSQLRQAVIEADKTLDLALSKLVTGETLGGRLKTARPLFEREVYNKIWQGHKVRNALVHEAGYEPPYYVCREAVEQFKEGLLALRINL